MDEGRYATHIPIDFPEEFSIPVIALRQRVCRYQYLPPFITPVVTHLSAKQRFSEMGALSFSGIVSLDGY